MIVKALACSSKCKGCLFCFSCGEFLQNEHMFCQKCGVDTQMQISKLRHPNRETPTPQS